MSDHDQSERRNTKLERMRRSPEPKREKGAGPIGKTGQKMPASSKTRRLAGEGDSAPTRASRSGPGGVVTAADVLAVEAARGALSLLAVPEEEEAGGAGAPRPLVQAGPGIASA